MKITLNAPDTLPPEFLKLRIQKIEKSLIAKVQFFSNYQLPNHETLLAIAAVERGEVEQISLDELRKLAQV